MIDAPPIQYCKTSDGVSIAYWTLGQGPPLLITPPLIFGHLSLEWQYQPLREWYLALSGSRLVVRYDPRNNGLSERGVQGMEQSAQVHDIEAVADRLAWEDVDVVGYTNPCVPALEFAARHAGLVRRLVLVSPVLSGAYWREEGALRALRSVKDLDYEMFLQTWAHSSLGWSSGAARAWTRFVAESITAEDMQAWWASIEEYDARPYLAAVTAEALVIRVAGASRLRIDYPTMAREIASTLPNGRLRDIRGEVGGYFETPEIVDAIGDFLEVERSAAHAGPDTPSGTAIIFFADIVDSTALSEQLGDAVFRERSRTLEERVRAQIVHHRGTPVEGRTLGDGVLATFVSASDAIAAALDCATAGEEVGLALHLGLHAGDVMRERGNVYGQAVSIASRVSDLSAPNEVLVSGTVRDLARASAGVSFEDRGERELKGVSEPVRVFCVKEQGTRNREQV